MSTALLLVGCVPPHQPPQAQIPQPSWTPLKTIEITPAELQRAEHKAYRRGFTEGRAYEQRLGPALQLQTEPKPTCPPATDTVQPAPAAQPAPWSPALSSPQPATQPSPTLPAPTPAYRASGPAQPLTP